MFLRGHAWLSNVMRGVWITKLLLRKISRVQRRTLKKCSHVASNFYVTTPIFYVNAGPHIGHLYSAVLADALARYNTMLDRSVILTTGTDEHGNKVSQAAKDWQLPIHSYCTQVSNQFKDMCHKFDVGYTNYIRTTESRHINAVHHFWNTLTKNGHIYLGKYSGWYCVPDEAFLTVSQLTEVKDDNGNTIKVSQDSGHPVDWTEENNYRFKLSAFQDDLRHWLKDENTVRPVEFHKILSSWIADGGCLEDLSISRPINRVPWGIPVPEDQSQTIYVWLDALVNYLTAVGYPDDTYKKSWPPSIQIIGKDILKFHGIYWPAFLMAAGLEPPRSILCHSHWTVDGEKMSKSKGNVVSPFNAANTFTADGLRYFLLREAVPHSDANYNEKKVLSILNAELANTLGNLVSRCTAKSVNADREIPHPGKYVQYLTSQIANDVKRSLDDLGRVTKCSYEQYNIHHVVDAVISTLHLTNKMVESHEPWKLSKRSDPESKRELKAVLSLAFEAARISGLVLYPVVPTLSGKLLSLLGVSKNIRNWSDTTPRYNIENENDVRQINEDRPILFQRIKE